MQLRLSNGSGGSFHGSNAHPARKHKQQAIFTYHNREQPPRNVYYDTNPYFLHASPSEPHLKHLITTSRHSSRSREPSDVQSQRSCKVVRANGLKLVEKPNFVKVNEQSPVNGTRTNQQSRRLMQREIELQAENKALKGENEYLRQKLRLLQESKKGEVRLLQDKIDYLQRITQNLEKKMQVSEQEWRDQVKKLQYSAVDDL